MFLSTPFSLFLYNILTVINKYKGIDGYFGDIVFYKYNYRDSHIRNTKLSHPGDGIFLFLAITGHCFYRLHPVESSRLELVSCWSSEYLGRSAHSLVLYQVPLLAEYY